MKTLKTALEVKSSIKRKFAEDIASISLVTTDTGYTITIKTHTKALRLKLMRVLGKTFLGVSIKVVSI